MRFPPYTVYKSDVRSLSRVLAYTVYKSDVRSLSRILASTVYKKFVKVLPANLANSCLNFPLTSSCLLFMYNGEVLT